MSENPFAPPAHDGDPPARGAAVSPAEADAIRKRIASLNSRSLLIGTIGIVMQVCGRSMSATGDGATGALLTLVGTATLIVGLIYYAQMRGRSGWWGLLGLLSCIGIVFLLLLPKRCHHCHRTVKGKECGLCGAPAPK